MTDPEKPPPNLVIDVAVMPLANGALIQLWKVDGSCETLQVSMEEVKRLSAVLSKALRNRPGQ